MPRIASGVRIAAAYAAGVFSVGFLLGTLRVLVVAPRVGTRTAELVELPLMVGASFLGAGWVNRRLDPAAPVRERLAVGARALLFLLGAEVAIGVALRGGSIGDALVNPDPVSGSLYYASLLLFALLPALRRPGRAANIDR